ncbi:TIGR00730 family Rossman fold protein [Saccharopolyspora erythraea]|uniref:LOG family protein n=1 Tax=Saccharopolyspora erythraea TaxID=1836 RepID=UPI001BAA6CF6|nr:TIGR00730 family Rossman fold protein [Saccharopolyspora erythraea]QUH04092.1 TIGR00730 family Rossman fold protein [Saccharopolyspora erythraea]
MTAKLSVGVFCGASTGNSPRYLDVGGDLGRLLAERGHRLVYGAGGVGVMGAVARSTAAGGGHILGVIPEFLRAREMTDDLPSQELVLTGDLFDRKRMMIGGADAFIALPGGYGTVDEVVEVLSMAALGLDVGPLVLIDVAGDWDPFLDMVDGLARRGFARRTDLCHVVGGAAEALDLVEALTVAVVPQARRSESEPARAH